MLLFLGFQIKFIVFIFFIESLAYTCYISLFPQKVKYRCSSTVTFMYPWNGFITKAAKIVLLIAFNFSAVLSFVDVILISSVSESKTSFE